ncbi:MAG: DUF695 domain-containing protein [Muribaculaceae bacterium]|nr:DUF695 domain-containing protein [Muribaculaceae bacterium]
MPKPSEIFWTYPAESESGKTIIITGRDKIDEFRLSGKYPYRINITWDYAARPDGMPASEEEAKLMEAANDLLLAETQRDPAAILTGIYTGDGRRDWVLYTRSLHIFRNILNRAFASLPDLPIKIDATEDPDWEEYTDMRTHTYIPDSKD